MTMTTLTKKVTISKTKEVAIDLPANPFVFEVFDLVNKMKTEQKKVEVLRKYEHPSLKALFIWNFDESVITILPPGQVPYSNLKSEQKFRGTLSDKVDNLIGTMNYNQTTSLGNASDLTEGHTTIRKETMFIQMLEGLHPLEAEIICLVKDKKLQTKYKITKEIVTQAYPDISWGGRS